MLTKVKSTSKKAMSILLAFVMCVTAFVLCNPIQADALSMGDYVQGRYYYYPEGTQFIAGIQFGQATKSDDAYNEATANGYTILTNDNGGGRLDFNSGVSGKDYIMLGYKTTTDITAALGTFLRMGHDNGGGSPYTFKVDGKDISFNNLGQDLNADAGGDYIYLYYTNDTSVGLPLLSLAGTNDRNTTRDGYYSVTKNDSDTEVSDANAGAGGDYVYLFFDNSSVYTEVTSYVTALGAAITKAGGVQDSSKYTAASWQTYQNALTEANRIWGIYNNRYKAGYVTTTQIEAATNALHYAVDGLQTTIRLDAATNGGTAETTEYTVTCGLSTVIDLPAGAFKASREGYSFLGWSTDASAESGSVGTISVPLASTVYAIFSVQKYNVYFINPITGAQISKQSVEYGKDATAPDMSTYSQKDTDEHYIFDGWDKEFTNIKADVTVMAVFTTSEHSYARTAYTAPTCSKTGSESFKCTDCGAEKTVSLPVNPDAHKNITNYPSKPSTCNEYGYTAYTYCNDCRKVISGREELPLGDHSWSEWSVTDPTCEADGYKTRQCTVCKTTQRETIPSQGHSWGEWEVKKQATCEAAGRSQRTCSACNTTEVQIINALQHDYDDVVTPPTCTERGYTTHTCKRDNCGKSYIDTYVDATGHSWEDVGEPIKKPTCTEDGTQYQECSACDATRTTTVEATGHDWQNQNVIKEATCDNTGLMGAECGNCGEVQDSIVIPALGHDWNAGEILEEVTCTKDGKKLLTCQRDNCGKTMETVIRAPGHTWDNGVVQSPASCSQTGEMLFTCTVCDETKTTEIPKLSHSFTGTVTPPTCDEGGYTEYVCTVCNEEIVDDIVPAKGHSYQSYTYAPTCIKDGYTFSRCSSCGHSQKSDIVPALGHDYVTTTVDPTCTEKGYDLHTCSRGDNSYKDNYVDELGHDYVMTTVAPTCKDEGYDLYVCSRGDHSYKENFVDALGHNYVEVDRINPTLTQNGFIIFECDACSHRYNEIIYTNDMALVCVTLIDSAGNPVTEAVITVTNMDTGESYVITSDLNGYFTEVLAEGDYELLIDRDGYDDTIGYIYVENGEATIDIPVMNAPTCDCYCHQNNFWAKIFRIFQKLRMLFGMEPNCCDNPEF